MRVLPWMRTEWESMHIAILHQTLSSVRYNKQIYPLGKDTWGEQSEDQIVQHLARQHDKKGPHLYAYSLRG